MQCLTLCYKALMHFSHTVLAFFSQRRQPEGVLRDDGGNQRDGDEPPVANRRDRGFETGQVSGTSRSRPGQFRCPGAHRQSP